MGMASVEMVANVCQMDEGDALACVQKLWRLHFIKTMMAGQQDEWKGHYAITGTGIHYVHTHAT
jgi:hypothetical protein